MFDLHEADPQTLQGGRLRFLETVIGAANQRLQPEDAHIDLRNTKTPHERDLYLLPLDRIVRRGFWLRSKLAVLSHVSGSLTGWHSWVALTTCFISVDVILRCNLH